MQESGSVRSRRSLLSTASFVVYNPYGPDFEFEGRLLIDFSQPDAGTIKVYQTRGGKYIVEQIKMASRGYGGVHRVEVVERKEDLAKIIGDTAGGKNVLSNLGMPYRVRIE